MLGIGFDGEKLEVVAYLEEDWKVVYDGVASAQLLHHLRRSAQKHAAEVLALAVGEEG